MRVGPYRLVTVKIIRLLGRRILTTPGGVGSIVAVLGLAALERSAAGIGLALLGAAVGVLAGIMVLQLGLLLGAALCGVRVHQVVVGVGARLRAWNTARRTVVLRAVPITLGVAIGPGRTPVRRRMCAAGVTAAVLAALCCAIVVWRAITGGAVLHGLAVGVVGSVLHALRPSRGVASTSTGWLLFGVPRLSGRKAQELDAAPMVNAAVDAVNAGDLANAHTAAEALAAAYPDLRSAVFTRVSVLEARGRYAEALPLVLRLLSDPVGTSASSGGESDGAEPDPRDTAVVLAGLAGLASAAVEAGQLDAEVGVPIARRAVTDVVDLGYPSYKLNGTRALLELLTGSPRRAAELAAGAASTGDHPLTRADDLATLARARMALGDNRSARSALAEAEDIAAWWPRVAATRATLDLA